MSDRAMSVARLERESKARVMTSGLPFVADRRLNAMVKRASRRRSDETLRGASWTVSSAQEKKERRVKQNTFFVMSLVKETGEYL